MVANYQLWYADMGNDVIWKLIHITLLQICLLVSPEKFQLHPKSSKNSNAYSVIPHFIQNALFST